MAHGLARPCEVAHFLSSPVPAKPSARLFCRRKATRLVQGTARFAKLKWPSQRRLRREMEQAQTPRTNTKPSREFAASAKLVIVRGAFGALSERNTWHV